MVVLVCFVLICCFVVVGVCFVILVEDMKIVFVSYCRNYDQVIILLEKVYFSGISIVKISWLKDVGDCRGIIVVDYYSILQEIIIVFSRLLQYVVDYYSTQQIIILFSRVLYYLIDYMYFNIM